MINYGLPATECLEMKESLLEQNLIADSKV
jgi:hypothetical protein